MFHSDVSVFSLSENGHLWMASANSQGKRLHSWRGPGEITHGVRGRGRGCLFSLGVCQDPEGREAEAEAAQAARA